MSDTAVAEMSKAVDAQQARWIVLPPAWWSVAKQFAAKHRTDMAYAVIATMFTWDTDDE